jgi:hypothetical protein
MRGCESVSGHCVVRSVNAHEKAVLPFFLLFLVNDSYLEHWSIEEDAPHGKINPQLVS